MSHARRLFDTIRCCLQEWRCLDGSQDQPNEGVPKEAAQIRRYRTMRRLRAVNLTSAASDGPVPTAVSSTAVTLAKFLKCVGVSLRRRLAIAVRSIGRDPHSAHLLPQDGYSRARNVCGLLDAGVVVLCHERLGPPDSCHALLSALGRCGFSARPSRSSQLP